MNTPIYTGFESAAGLTRRRFLDRFGMGLGGIALSDLLQSGDARAAGGGFAPTFAPKARRVIYLFQSGAPSQMDLFDYKPMLNEKHGTELPDENPDVIAD